MFSYLNNPIQQVWLTMMLVLWAALLFGGYIFGQEKEGRRMPGWTRLGSSAVLVIAGFSWVVISRNYGTGSYALLLAMGMTFGLLGDLFLAKVFTSGMRANIGGIIAFAIGHLLYIAGIWRLGNEWGLTNPGSQLTGLVLWWLVAALGWYFIVFRGSQATFLHWFVLPYALLLATTAGVATGLALQTPAFWPLALGAALFLFSDMLIGGNWFNNLDFPLVHDLIWLTYGPGQMLIVYSAGTALQHVL
jgi:hypothetical protein